MLKDSSTVKSNYHNVVDAGCVEIHLSFQGDSLEMQMRAQIIPLPSLQDFKSQSFVNTDLELAGRIWQDDGNPISPDIIT